MINKHSNKEEILAQAENLYGKTLRSFVDIKELKAVEDNVNFQNGNEFPHFFGNFRNFAKRTGIYIDIYTSPTL